MDDVILITELNDFVFCPASIYFHKLYGGMDTMLFQGADQINGTNAYERIDTKKYFTLKHILMRFDVYYGVLHTCFYMRKSLVCDIMEPFRPLIDWRVRKGFQLGHL